MGWATPWYSSYGSVFNYDFHATLDKDAAPVEYNFVRRDDDAPEGSQEGFGISAFVRDDERVFHTYSTYARGADQLLATYGWLDLTALGGQEDWEQPEGRSAGPAMSWLHRHDQYDA